PVRPNHAPGFAPDVRTALPAGIGAMVSAARQVLGAGPGGGGEAR
ncbi:amidohydrolase, partial [Streptomyces sp. NPDC055080]